jgi:hypothetical protein
MTFSTGTAAGSPSWVRERLISEANDGVCVCVIERIERERESQGQLSTQPFLVFSPPSLSLSLYLSHHFLLVSTDNTRKTFLHILFGLHSAISTCPGMAKSQTSPPSIGSPLCFVPLSFDRDESPQRRLYGYLKGD